MAPDNTVTQVKSPLGHDRLVALGTRGLQGHKHPARDRAAGLRGSEASKQLHDEVLQALLRRLVGPRIKNILPALVPLAKEATKPASSCTMVYLDCVMKLRLTARAST